MMPAYNAEEYIGQAIESILAQTYADWELIIVNDGSKDRTAEVASRYSDPRIRLIHQENAGEAAARNTALEHMRGEYVAFLDADDAYLPNHLELTIGYLRTHPDRDGVYSDGYHIDRDGKLLKPLSSRRRGPFEGWLFEQLVRASDVFGPPICIVLRRELIARHNLAYDPEIVIGPDWDFNTRYSEFAQFGYIGEATCHYRVHQTNITLTAGLQRRILSLARCREKAIHLGSFNQLAVETRVAVFYDLLVELMTDYPERQDSITCWPEFELLPASERARLLRLMASKAAAKDVNTPYIKGWLKRARQLNPADRQAAILDHLRSASPQLFKGILRIRYLNRKAPAHLDPFGDLNRNK
jgi:glycosyltransferase involved in cell wall biosynthesis